LGTSLLKRSTRVVKLTEIGQNYYALVCHILSQLEATDEAVGHYQSRPIGQLRISSIVGFGETIFLPLMDRFSARYPDITLDITLTDSLSVLNRDDVDLAIRGGFAPDERVIATRLMDNHFIAVASTTYCHDGYWSPSAKRLPGTSGAIATVEGNTRPRPSDLPAISRDPLSGSKNQGSGGFSD
jgi:DNA-binding transcriptional LysR family regulator